MSQQLPVFYLGDDWTMPTQVLVNGAATSVIGKTVKAALVDHATAALLVGPADVDLGHADGLPGQGLVVPVFTAAAITAGGVATGPCLLEIQVDGQTWHRASIRVEQRAIP